MRAFVEVAPKWMKVRFPFNECNLNREFDWTRVIRIYFETTPDPGVEWSWRIDDFKIVPECEPMEKLKKKKKKRKKKR